MDETSVNKKCTQNSTGLDPKFKGYSEKTPDSSFHGCQRHFFAKPMQEYVDYVNDNMNRVKDVGGENKMKAFIEI